MAGRAAVVEEVVGVLAPGKAGSANGTEAGCVVVAEPGCGATTTLGAIADRLRSDGRPVGQVAGSPHSSGTPGAALAGLLASGPLRTVDGDGPTAATLAASSRLEAMVEGPGSVVVVDDAQWLDETSAALLGCLRAEDRAAIVVGVRAGSDLPRSLAPLLRDPAVARVTLGPLSAEEVAAVLQGLWAAPATDALVERVRTASDGRPGRAVQVATAWRAAGAIRPSHGVWDLVDGVPPPIRPGDDALPPPGPERTALAVAALVGVAPVAPVEALVGLDALAALERDGLLVLDEAGPAPRLRLARASVAASVTARLTAEERRAVFASLLEAAAAVPSDDIDPVERADWSVQAGRALPAADALAAARAAFSRGEVERADRLAAAVGAVDAVDAVNAPGTVVAAATLRALVRWHQGRVAESLSLLDEVVEASGGGDRIDALRLRLLIRAHATDDVDDALDAAEEAVAGADEATARAVTPMIAYLALLAGAPARAGSAARGWLEAAPPDDPRREQARTVAAFAALQTGRPLPEPSPAALASRPSAVSSPASELRWDRGVLVAGALARLHEGEVAEATAAADEIRQAARSDGDRFFEGWAAVVAGLARLQAGAVVAAQADWVHAWRTFVPLGLDSRLRAIRAGLRVIEALDVPGVRTLAERGWLETVSDGPGMILTGEQARLEVLLGVLEAEDGIAARARRTADDLARRGLVVASAGVRYLGSFAPGWSDESDAAAADVAALADLAPRLAGDQVARWASDAAARAAREPGGHLAAASALVAAGDALSAHLSLRQARAWSSERGLVEALRALAATTDLPLPSDLDAPAAERLTRREMEVARLVASGATSKEVAAGLGVSPRTVDATLAKVYRKLGLRGRADLPGALDLAGSLD